MRNQPQKTPNPAPAADEAAQPAAAANPGDKKPGFISAGQHIHKWSTYLSVDWIFNAAVGVAFAYWGKFTDSGKRFWSEPVTKGFSKMLRPFIKNPEQRQKSAGYGNMFMSIIAGGMFTIPPLMVLENNKVKKSIIKFWDGLIYGKDKVENDPQFQQAYNEIEEAPKKDFWTGLTSRLAALAPLLAIVLIPTTKKISNRLWFDHVERGSELAATKLGFSPETSFKAVSPPQARERWKFIHESVAMDFGLGVPYAVLHAFFYNMFAAIKGKKKDTTKEEAKPPPQTEAVMSEPAMEKETKIFVDRQPKLLPQASHAKRETYRRNETEFMPVIGG